MEERIGHYSIVSELGRGGMGVVYKAHEQSLNRFVALKVLGQHLSEDESYVERFKREAQSAAALNHPNIVQVYSIDDFDGRHCFAMEFVQGASIQQMIKGQGPMDPVTAAQLILQAASGLGAAHQHGIIHRDIKPANLMVDDRGLVKIADFGLALLAAGATRLTATGMFMGTPGYLSPEQCLDQNVDQRADIYSLGVTFYEMLTGVTPFKADSPLALLRQIIDVEPKDVGELRPEVPEALRSILRKMMVKDREERFADCGSLVSELQEWLNTAGGASANIGAVVAAAAVASTVASSAPKPAATTPHDLNTDPTLRVDSAQLAAGPPPPPPPVAQTVDSSKTNEDSEPEMVAAPVTDVGSTGKGSKVVLGLALATAAALVLFAVTGYAAWKFGAVDALKGMMAGSSVETESSELARVEPAAALLDAEIESQDPPDSHPDTDTTIDEHDAHVRKSNVASTSPVTRADVPASSTSQATKDAIPNADNGQPSTATGRQKIEAAPVYQEPTIGRGVALVSVGETLLAGVTSDFVRQSLEKRGVHVFDGMAVPGVAALVESGSGDGESLQDLLRPHARYVVVVRAEYTGDRELFYMGRYDREYQARLHLVAHDLLDGTPLGPGVHAPIGYTQLTVDQKVEDLLRPKFRRIMGAVSGQSR